MFSIIILAIIQGITEFLPISSSFHLIIFRDIFFIGQNIINENISLTFDIALHLGTALAIIVYFFKDFLNIFIDGIKRKNNVLLNIIFATIPTAIIGFLLEEKIENFIRNKYLLITLIFILIGIIIYLIDKSAKNNKRIEDMKIKDAILIGCSQVLALIPGFSRSGTTIIGARLLKINREDAAKFSFYLSVPVVLGALLIQLLKIDLSIIIENISVFIMGISISFIVGLLCIKHLLKYLKNNDFKIFMWYRIVFGILIFIDLLMR